MQALIDKEESFWTACARLAADEQIAHGLCAGGSADEPILLAYGPVARRNQFQALLYSAAREHHFAVLPLQRTALFERIPWAGRVACHFHWLQDSTSKVTDAAAAEAMVSEWRRLISAMRANGAAIIWTVHNMIPHESDWPEHDRQIHQLVADAADVVHTMSLDTTELCAPYYGIDASKVMHVPHPSYAQAQGDWIGRAEARGLLDIPGDAFVFMSFGAVLPYKGYGRLMRAFDEVRAVSARRIHLIVAGQPAHAQTVAELRLWALGREDITLDFRPVPSDELQVYFRATDVAVCPYERTLNSGAALMAISFDTPVIGPRVGGFIDTINERCGILFDQKEERSLQDAMLAMTQRSLDVLRDSCRQLKTDLAPAVVSREFFSRLRSRLAECGSWQKQARQ